MPLDHLAQLASLDLLDHRDLLVVLVNLAQSEALVLQETLVLLELLDHLEHLE